MNFKIKYLIISIIVILITISANAQNDDKIVTLIVTGYGKTEDIAKQNALRSAIEQAFGAFISSKTEILNDTLVKEEIVSVTNGNIHKYEIISQIQVPEGGFATTIKATVSVTKLTSFIENKGYETEFKGSTFGANLRQQNLNESSEQKSILDLCIVSNYILSKSLDYSLSAGEPKKAVFTSGYPEPKEDEYYVPLKVKIIINENYEKFIEYFTKTINSIKMNINEIENYKNIGKKVYVLQMENPKNSKIEYLSFRNPKSVIYLQNLFIKSNRYIHNFIITTNLDTINVKTCCPYRDTYYNQFRASTYRGYNKSDLYNLNYNTWGLNIEQTENNVNNHKSFPDFTFDLYGASNEFNAWDIYAEYLSLLQNHTILFNNKYYFNLTVNEWKKFGNPISDPEWPYNSYPGTGEGFETNLGTIRFTKTDYYCIYYALYSESKLSKINSFLVKKL